MKKTATITTLLLATLMITSSAFAWPGYRDGKGSGDCNRREGRMNYEQHVDRMVNRLERMAVILDLSAEQKTTLEELNSKHFQDRQVLRSKMEKGRDELQAYRFSDKFDEKEFRALAQQHADLKTEMMVQGAKHRQDILAVLTPEQREKADKLREMGGFGPGDGPGRRGFDPDDRGFGPHGKTDCDGRGPAGKGQGQGYRYNN